MKTKSIFKMTLLALFTAIILIMDFTPLGYIQTGGFVIALMTLPVGIGAVCLGKNAGMYLGGLFGLTSFLMCFGIGFVIDPSAQLMFNTSPLGTAFTCFVPRIFAGFLTAAIFDFFSRKKFSKLKLIHFIASCGCMPLFNTLFFISSYALVFKNTLLAETTVEAVFISAFSVNGAIEIILNVIVGSAVCSVLYTYINKLSTK